MSLSLSAIRYLAWEHMKQPFSDPVLTLGRQMVFCTLEDARWAIRLQGIEPADLQANIFTGQTIPNLDEKPYSLYTNDRVIFYLLGLRDFHSLDISNYQGATITHDLNIPVPKDCHSRFGLIVDGGTLEHIFDIRQALENLSCMLRPGGRVIHMSPASGYLNHGFYQFSPSLFCTYYEANEFENIHCLVAEHPRNKSNHTQWHFWKWNREIRRKRFLSDETLAIYVSATKTERSTGQRIPQQIFESSDAYASTSKAFEKKPWGLEYVNALKPEQPTQNMFYL